MSAIGDAALDHAVMAEDLLRQVDSLLLSELVDGTTTSTWHRAAILVSAAQVHATLALVPTGLEAAVGFEVEETAVRDEVLEVGARVLLLDPPIGRRRFPTISSDTFGTVAHVWHSEDGGPIDMARVEWDDGIDPTEHPITRLVVVLGV